MILSPGKIPPELLDKTVFKFLGAYRNDVIMGPSKGEDAAIVSVGGKLLVFHADPISGANEKIGWISMNVATNDIATRGVKPLWALSCIMLPVGSEEKILEKICIEMSLAAQKLGVSIVGGHSEVTPGIDHPLVIVFALGVAEGNRYVTTGGAKAGSKIILTKSVGIEGTAILSSDRRGVLIPRLGKKLVEVATSYFDRLSILDEALTAFAFGGVQAMHDPTEGGISNGLHEVADASKTGFRIYEDAIKISYETLKICVLLGINPLNLISSGSLLIVSESSKAVDLVNKLVEKGIDASIIGDVLADDKIRTIVRRNGTIEYLSRPLTDELWAALAKEI
ncbi:MAG: hydrogenase expression/formation protein HypE [Thermoproteota archaeon]|nr:hydrogenase expression/formation protein HypE [Thermoproteota archaeon]